MTLPNEPSIERETGSREITETDLVLHAAHSGDFYPHHLDAEFCRTQPFGQRIAHGTLTFIFAVELQHESWPDIPSPTAYDKLRFVRPVHIGDRIRVRVSPADNASLDNTGTSRRERCEVFNQKDQLVLIFEQSF